MGQRVVYTLKHTAMESFNAYCGNITEEYAQWSGPLTPSRQMMTINDTEDEEVWIMVIDLEV